MPVSDAANAIWPFAMHPADRGVQFIVDILDMNQAIALEYQFRIVVAQRQH